MARPLRYCPANQPVHVVQRGNNRLAFFTCDEDMAAFASSLFEGAEKHQVAIHSWVFMSNHVHLLMTPSTDQGVSRLMRHMGRNYAQPFNFRYARTGPLFDGRFRSSVVQDEIYLLNCIRYIELNPVRAGMTSDPENYRWSSYRCHAYGKAVRLWSPHPEYLGLGKSGSERQRVYREMVAQSLSAEAIQKIRHCVNTGKVLGSETFRDQIQALRS